MDALIKRFLTNDVLQDLYKYVTSSTQDEGEIDAKFAVRMSPNSRPCFHAFRKDDVVNYFIWGFNPSVLKLVAHKVRKISASDKFNLEAVKQATKANGKSQRIPSTSETKKESSVRGDSQKGTRFLVK